MTSLLDPLIICVWKWVLITLEIFLRRFDVMYLLPFNYLVGVLILMHQNINKDSEVTNLWSLVVLSEISILVNTCRSVNRSILKKNVLQRVRIHITMTIFLIICLQNHSSVGYSIFMVPACAPLHHFPGTTEGLWLLDLWSCNF